MTVLYVYSCNYLIFWAGLLFKSLSKPSNHYALTLSYEAIYLEQARICYISFSRNFTSE